MADDTTEGNPGATPGRGVILRARNGDILRYDETGLVMRLSDRVIADIRRRLDAGAVGDDATPPPAAAAATAIDAEILGDIDAWDVTQQGDWLVFSANLPGEQGPRRFRRLVDVGDEGADIIADAPGPLFGMLSIGGARRALATQRMNRFPHHVVAAADHVGAVGVSGIEPAEQTDRLHILPEQSRDALIAETWLAHRHAANRALPLIVARTETDASASIADLALGSAFDNLVTAAGNLNAAADLLGKRPRLLAVGLDYSLEDVRSDAPVFRDGMHALMGRIEQALGRLGFRKPAFVATFDCGTRKVTDHPVLRAQWDLAWNSGDHDLLYSAPGYMFAQDDTGRPTDEARQEMAEMDAAAIEAAHRNEAWFCPIFLLAEREPDPSVIRVRARAMGDLVIDEGDPFKAGPHLGFRLSGVTNGAEIASVARAEDDPQDILIRCTAPPEGDALELLYGFGAPPSKTAHPGARGAIRDGWEAGSATGRRLHRWALPCALPVH